MPSWLAEDWAYAAFAWCLFGGAASLLLWAIVWDRARGRSRCPRCWYDVAGLLSAGQTARLVCPECGHESTSLRSLHRTRRRWKWIGAALACMAGAWVVGRWPSIRDDGWTEVVPTWAIAVLVRDPLALIDAPDARSRHRAGYLELALQRRFALDPADAMTNRIVASRMSRACARENALNAPMGVAPLLVSRSLADLAEPSKTERLKYCMGSETWSVRSSGLERTGSYIEQFATTASHVDADRSEVEPWVSLVGTTLVVSASPRVQDRVDGLLAAVRTGPHTNSSFTMSVHSLAPLREMIMEHSFITDRGDPWSDAQKQILDFVVQFVDADGWLDNGGDRSEAYMVGACMVVVTPQSDENLHAKVGAYLSALASESCESDADDRTTVFSIGDVIRFCAPPEDFQSLYSLELFEQVRLAIVAAMHPDWWTDNGGRRATIGLFGSRLVVQASQPEPELRDRVARLVESLKRPGRRIDVEPGLAVFDARDALRARLRRIRALPLATNDLREREVSLFDSTMNDVRTALDCPESDPQRVLAWAGSRIVARDSAEKLDQLGRVLLEFENGRE